MSKDKINNFLELYNTEWQTYAINSKACYRVRKANKPEPLPIESDVQLFRDFVVFEIEKLLETARTTNLNVEQLRELSKFTLARSLTYNACRGSEVSRLTLEHWEGVEDDRWKSQSDISNIDDILELALAKRMKICYLEGKKKNKNVTAELNNVPILFTNEVVEAIRILNKCRKQLSIPDDNIYVFAQGEGFRPGWDTLQWTASKVEGLEKPELITPNRTRKSIATQCQLFDINDADLTMLTNHFGHTKAIHNSWYRKESSTLELTKIARLLTALDKGYKIKNKKIDDLLSEPFVDPLASAPVSSTSNNESRKRKKDTKKESKTEESLFESKKQRIEESEQNVFLEESKSADKTQEDTIPKRKVKKKTWQKWSEDEMAILNKVFHIEIKRGIVPTTYDIRDRIRNYPTLVERGEMVIRNKIRNHLQKMGKKK